MRSLVVVFVAVAPALALEVGRAPLWTRRALGRCLPGGMAAGVGAPLLTAAPAAAREQALLQVGEQAPPLSDTDVLFTTLASGVKVKSLRAGEGAESVGPKSTVFVECTGRLLNLNGIKFYSTKDDPSAKELGGPEPLRLVLGSGSVVPGLEEGLLGAKKGEIRRIIVPSRLGYDDATTQLIPVPNDVEAQRALDSVVKNPRRDATLLFDVKVLRIR